MCGIAGYVQKARVSFDGMKMLDAIRHRGPDATGTFNASFEDWSIFLGHARLSIIDLTTGQQPMANSDRSLSIVFNGEIFNYRELRDQLVLQGHHFATESDTEVILHLYEERGVEAFDALNGMFAFALWDVEKKSLFIARDRVGIKPLYYSSLPGNGVLFSSELTAVLSHPDVKREISKEGLSSYLFLGYAQSPQTLVRNIHKLQPGHYLVWNSKTGTSEQRRFWKMKAAPSLEAEESLKSDDALAKELWERLEQAVRRQMIADVPLGVFLSGGIDSSIVAALASKHAGKKLKTFSIGFEDKNYDESPYAREMARFIGSDHVEEIFSEQKLLSTIDPVLQKLDEPIADQSILPTYLLAQLASKSVKVVLGGDGGDELWAGYHSYYSQAHRQLYEWVPDFLRRNLVRPFVFNLPFRNEKMGRIQRFVKTWQDDPMQRHLSIASYLDLEDVGKVTRQNYAFPYRPIFPADSLNSRLALDFSTYLPGSVLAKVDRASMAHGLEVRPPFLDNEFIDWSFGLPSSLKMRKNRGKFLLKLAAQEQIPRQIIERSKRGFGIPLATWLRGPLRPYLKETFSASPLWGSGAASGILDKKFLSQLKERHLNFSGDFSRPLWALIVLNTWIKREGIDCG